MTNLLNDLKQGKSTAFEQLYQKYYKMVASFIKNNKGTEDDARDIFQEAIFALIKNLQKPDFELKAKLGTYLYSIARYLWLHQLRGKKNLAVVDIAEGVEPFVDMGEEEIQRKQELEKKHELLQKVLKGLKEDCRKLIIAYYYKKISLKTYAEQAGYTYAFTKVKKNRCMNGFKKRMAQEPEYKLL